MSFKVAIVSAVVRGSRYDRQGSSNSGQRIVFAHQTAHVDREGRTYWRVRRVRHTVNRNSGHRRFVGIPVEQSARKRYRKTPGFAVPYSRLSF